MFGSILLGSAAAGSGTAAHRADVRVVERRGEVRGRGGRARGDRVRASLLHFGRGVHDAGEGFGRGEREAGAVVDGDRRAGRAGERNERGALRAAVEVDPRRNGEVPSTKGVIV